MRRSDSYGGFEHGFRGQTRGCDLAQVVFQDEMVAPELLDVVLERAARRTEIKKTGLAIVDLEALDVVEFALEQVLDFSATVLGGEVLGRGLFLFSA